MDIDIFYTLQEKKRAAAWKNNDRNEHYIFFSINGYKEQMKALAVLRDDMLLCD
jgi:hypothetical protein